MRSSKSRSRSKSNRPRSMGNIVNRVFDSSGPEGKVRGTPQQIIEKYLVLARDAQLANDRVAHENFLQHAEHYTRMLGEAQREMAREQENRRDQQQQAEAQPNREQGNRDRRDRGESDAGGATEVIDLGENGGSSGLVETPEQKSAERESAAPRPATEAAGKSEAPEQAEMAAKPATRKPRAPRKPRKPAKTADETPTSDTRTSAAE